MRTCRLSFCLAAAVIALTSRVSAAPPAPVAPGTTLKQAFEAAWSRAPVARSAEGRQEEAAAARLLARSWMAASPTLGLSHRADTGGAEREGSETEMSLASQLWLPGQKAAREALAARSSEEARVQLGVTRLQVAGIVRSRIWEVAAARVRLDEKRDHLHHLEGLADEVDRRVHAGDLARSDALLVRQEVLAAQVDVSEALTASFEALARYRAVTGLAALPALEPEALQAGDTDADVRLLAAQASEQRARAALRVAETSRSAPPILSLSVRREDERLLREPIRSIGVAVQIPFGTAARNGGAEAQAQTAIATAAAEASELRANAGAEREIARARLANTRAALEIARARASALHEHTALFEKAFRLGERGLAELLRSRALTHEADVAVAQQQVALGLAHAMLNQASGVLP